MPHNNRRPNLYDALNRSSKRLLFPVAAAIVTNTIDASTSVYNPALHWFNFLVTGMTIGGLIGDVIHYRRRTALAEEAERQRHANRSFSIVYKINEGAVIGAMAGGLIVTLALAAVTLASAPNLFKDNKSLEQNRPAPALPKGVKTGMNIRPASNG